ncbi:MAG: hypothetical protein F4211_02825, partial [Acidimicrobiia bacterium]|nr:hypothetical protein [Acidimicrobiia bacterium]
MREQPPQPIREPRNLSWRVGVLAVIFTVGLSLLFFRLWYVQLATGEVWAREADQNIVSVEPIPARRGDIVDRNGLLLATSVPNLVIEIDRAVLPLEVEDEVIQRLAAILDVSPVEVRQAVERTPSGQVASLIGFEINADTAYLILEQRSTLPGVEVRALPIRGYPNSSLMGHVLGHMGLPSPEDLERLTTPYIDTPVGKLGVEREYDPFLQGTPGKTAYRIDPEGNILELIGTVDPVPGSTVRLTLDADLQREVERILIEAVDLSNAIKAEQEITDPDEIPPPTERSTALVMEINTGAIRAMASYPTFEPEGFVGGIDVETFEELSDRQAFNNLAIQGLKPPASTFKTITYVTAMEESIFPEGVSSPEETIERSARLSADFTDDSQLLWRNWTFPEADGDQNLHDAFRRSCNIYFWEVALSIWDRYARTDREGIVQEWASALGLGRPTQVDLPFEQEGILGNRQLFEEWQENQPWRVRQEGWLGGDLMNLVVGQGPIVTTPLQMAVAYASLMNGGSVYQPRVAEAIETAEGERIRTLGPRLLRTVDISPSTVESLRRDMTAVVSSGTARRAFQDMGPMVDLVGGKTGTAQSFVDQEGQFHD